MCAGPIRRCRETAPRRVETRHRSPETPVPLQRYQLPRRASTHSPIFTLVPRKITLRPRSPIVQFLRCLRTVRRGRRNPHNLFRNRRGSCAEREVQSTCPLVPLLLKMTVWLPDRPSVPRCPTIYCRAGDHRSTLRDFSRVAVIIWSCRQRKLGIPLRTHAMRGSCPIWDRLSWSCWHPVEASAFSTWVVETEH